MNKYVRTIKVAEKLAVEAQAQARQRDNWANQQFPPSEATVEFTCGMWTGFQMVASLLDGTLSEEEFLQEVRQRCFKPDAGFGSTLTNQLRED